MNFSPLKLSQLKWSILTTAHRFPIIIALMFVATCCAIWNLVILDIDGIDESVSFEGFRWAIILGSGLPLYVGFFIWHENQQWSMRIPRALIFAAIIGIHIYIGQHILEFDLDNGSRQQPFWILSWLIIVHLIPAVLPFWHARKKEDFWSFNYWMMKNFLASSFYIALIYAGIALALSATQLLIYKDLSPKFYALFFFLLVGIFHPIFFLSSAPQEEETGNSEATLLPLQRIQQWILSPLVIVYLTILYLYAGKIIFTATLPKGWVSIWILFFCCIGVFNWLLGQPFKTEFSSKWSITSHRFFWYIIPLIVLLWWAIGYRLLEYGLTEVRAIVVYLALFLSFITLYFGFAPKTRIIVVPITLLMVTFLFQHGGPLSAKSLSFHSQMEQWNNIKNQPSAYTANEAKDVLRYLSRYHSEQADLYCLQCDTNSLNVENVEDYDWAANQMESAKLSFKEDSIETTVNRIIRFENNQFIALNGYQELIEISNQVSDIHFSDGLSAMIISENIDDPEHQNETIQIQFRNKEGVVHSEFIGQMKEKIKLSLKNTAHSNDLICEYFTIDFAYNEKQYRFITSELNYDQDSNQLYYIEGHLLLKKK